MNALSDCKSMQNTLRLVVNRFFACGEGFQLYPNEILKWLKKKALAVCCKDFLFLGATPSRTINSFVTNLFARIVHKPDRFWRKAFQPEAVVLYCEG